MQVGVKITGHGRYLPGEAIDNLMLIQESGINSSDDWIVEHLGILKRHWAKPGINTSHIATTAALRALENAGLEGKVLDRIVLGTSTADHNNLATACKVQFNIDAKCPSFDVISACASFIYALDVSMQFVKHNQGHVLVIGADVKSRFVNKKDKRFLPIFGDGGAAFVLSPTHKNDGFIHIVLWTDGSRYEDILNPAGGSAMPATYETVEKSLHSTRMLIDGKEAMQAASSAMENLCRKICNEVDMDLKDIDFIVPHHANIQIMKLLMQKLDLPMYKLFSTIHDTGNMVSGSVAYAFSRLLQTKAGPGNIILLVTVGAGITGGAALYKVPSYQLL